MTDEELEALKSKDIDTDALLDATLKVDPEKVDERERREVGDEDSEKRDD